MSNEHYDALKLSIQNATTEVIKLLKSSSGAATQAANANKVDGLDESALKSKANEELAAHLAADNPHGITPSMLGSYTKEEILALTTTGIPSSLIPVSFYGMPDQVNIAYTTDGLTVKIPTVKAFIQGTSRTVPETTVSLAGFDNTNTVRLYLRYRLGALRYEVTTAYRPESYTNMLIGWFKTSNGTVADGYIEVVYRIDIYRISVTPRGSAILATMEGDVTATGYIDKGWFGTNASTTSHKGIRDE